MTSSVSTGSAKAEALAEGVAVAGAAVPDGVGLDVAPPVGGDGVGLAVAATQSFVAVEQGFSKIHAWMVSVPSPAAPV